jgi:tetratricopeptide (TPR) repeat protein
MNRVEFLQSTGRADSGFAILRPYLSDVSATVGSDPRGSWLIEYGAYALLAQGREAEAAALYARLIEIPLAEQPGLFDTNINYASFLWQLGRYRESLAQTERMLAALVPQTSDETRTAAWSAMVCALAGLERTAEARAWLQRMEARPDDYPNALMRAYLCLADLDAAERYALRRLGSDDPASAVTALQDWQLAEAPGAPAAALETRMAALRARPAVAAALDRIGHVLRLPANRTHWGGF